MLYQNVIDEFIDMSKEIIGYKLTGIYLHGSMAMNCFNPEKSDIDLLIVIENDITHVQKMEFMKQTVKLNEQAPGKGLEISIVKREYCKPFVYPTPFELHFSPIHLEWFRDNPENYVENMKGEDKDLAAHFTIINRYGIMLYGEQIENIFGEVSKKDYVESVWFDVEDAREDIANEPMNMTLNLCRVLALLKEDLCLSKQKGGEWGIAHMPERYHSLILQALDCYKTNQIMQEDIEIVGQFADEMLTIIRSEKEQIEK
ncbi:streptomycin 3'-adenylyltransferase [Mobilisporobacter senegalensis]|uniref:Streptomycin 3'-adenylyltransferase n=1 Tax=Mobilisporobacter senegalensis TaxID=1329262 RepID=A0A3N1XRF6_9FIRM|nr:aminoglycoside adenylyltransferase domain-containing protein [Mobilisporobacter senegalensis]ROR29226.1 streptomycin 3'-adenylyltransferase [Mobilisporobacter senegalensis]